jgi:hypothetical protein
MKELVISAQLYIKIKENILVCYLHYFTLKPIIEVREDKPKLIGII